MPGRKSRNKSKKAQQAAYKSEGRLAKNKARKAAKQKKMEEKARNKRLEREGLSL